MGRVASGGEVLPGEIPATGMPPDALDAAAEELRNVRRGWAGLTPGEVWVVEWKASARRARRR